MAKKFEFVKAEQRSQKWLDLRAEGIGASDIPAVIGVSPYKTPYQLWAEKRGEFKPAPLGAAADRGILLEDSVAAWYEKETGRKTKKSNGIVRLKIAPWAMASLDRTIVGEPDGLLEIKTSASPRWSLYPVPPEVIAQVQWQMYITGAAWCDVAALLGGLTFKVVRVMADPAYQKEIMAKAIDFRLRVQSGNAPSVQGTDSDVFAALHPQTSEEYVPASDEIERLASSYEEAQLEEKIATERMQDLAMQLKEMIGEKSGIIGHGWQATWKENKPTRKTDWRSVAEELNAAPAVIDVHTKEVAGARVFRFRRNNDGE